MREMFVHQFNEIFVVLSFKQVQQLVDDYIFSLSDALFCEFQVYPNPPGLLIAGSPPRFHSLYSDCRWQNADSFLPFREQLIHYDFQLAAIPVHERLLSLRARAVRPNT